MATLPSASTVVSDTAGAVAKGVDTICIACPVATNADVVPRLYGTAAAIYAQHGYSEGVDYAELHASRTGKNFMFVGLPIATPGAVSRVNQSGNTGSSVVTAAAGGSGVLGEHDGEVEILTGGTVGTSQIVIGLSCDDGRTQKRVRLGTATSYTIPFLGVTLNFAAGTLVAGDVVLTWHGSAPRSNAAGWTALRTELAAQQGGFRSLLLCGDLQNSTEAQALLDEMSAYETANERFKYARASVLDRRPFATMSQERVVMTGAPTLTFLEVGATGDTITRSAGSWISDGFVVGDTITVALSVSNNVTGPIASLSATVITLNTTDLVNEGPVAGCTVVGTPTLTFAEVGATGDTITRSRGSWLTDGFRVGDLLTIDNTVGNDQTEVGTGVTALTATVLTLGTTDLVAEVIGSYGVTLTAGQTKAAWMSAIDTAFASVNGFRIDMSAGRGRVRNPFSGWNFRRPAGWAASLREYAHDLHIATWRKSDGVTGFDLFDADGQLVEWDDRADGAGGSAARFTTFRTWSNGPVGAFMALSLTRGDEGSLLSLTHNVAVVNLACEVTQLNTEDAAIGQSLILNDDGTATSDSLATVQKKVNDALELALLTNRGEGPRASKAVWTPSADDVLNVPDALMTGTLDLNLNGTVHSVSTVVRVLTNGAA